MNTIDTRVKWKRDTSANWTSNNPVLLNGEVIIVDTNAGETRFKVGNGTSTYTQLPFQDEYLQNAITDVDEGLIAHEQNHSNPHQVGKDQVGLGNVDNVKQYSAINPPPYPVTSVNGIIGAVNLDANDVNAVPTSRTINGKALSSDITLTYDDVGARPDTWVPTLSNLGITATASELNKLDGATVTTQEINYLDGVSSNIQTQLNGKVPTSRTINGQALTGNITLDAADVGALSTAGGTLTGNLTGKYLTGTWLQSTATTNLGSSSYKGICVFDGSGWVYYRTPNQILNDIGAAPDYTYSTTDLTAGSSSLATGKMYLVYE